MSAQTEPEQWRGRLQEFRRVTRRRFGSYEDWKVRLTYWVGALLVGLASVGFAHITDFATSLFRRLVEWNPFAPIVVIPMGLMLTSWVMYKTNPAVSGSGIPQVLVALEPRFEPIRKKLLSMTVVVFKVFLTFTGLLVGASIGREGPSIHVGASIMYKAGRIAGLKSNLHDHSLIAAGGAAGIAAAFNAPLAGVVFAIEELARNLEQRTSGTLIIAMILSGVVVQILSGGYSYFGTSPATVSLVNQWDAIAAVGVVCGMGGGLFSLALIVLGRRIRAWSSQHPYQLALICGLLLAAMGLASHGTTYSSGYREAKLLLDGDHPASLWFPLLKPMATLVSYLSGIPGGLFSPSLSAGAGIGALMAPWFHGVNAPSLAVVGMACFLAAVVQRPITAFVIVMEMTGNNHSMLLPLMAGTLLASGVSQLFCHQPVYHALATPFMMMPTQAQSPEQAEEEAMGVEQPKEPAKEEGKESAAVKSGDGA